jgi:hypothetical protein
MCLGSKVTIPSRGDGERYTVHEVLPAGQVTVTRLLRPWELVWGNYARPSVTANMAGITRVYCQVASMDHLEVVR